MSNLYYSTYFLTCNTKGNVLKNVHAALFYTVKVDGDQSLSSSKKDKIAPEKLHKVVCTACALYSKSSLKSKSLFTQSLAWQM